MRGPAEAVVDERQCQERSVCGLPHAAREGRLHSHDMRRPGSGRWHRVVGGREQILDPCLLLDSGLRHYEIKLDRCAGICCRAGPVVRVMIGDGPVHAPGSSDPEPDHDPGTLPAPSWDWQTPPITAPGPVLRLADTADAWTRWDLSDAICSMQAASTQSAACRLHHAISQPSREMWKA